MRTALALIATLALFGTAATAEPKTYEIDPAHTQTMFSVGRFGFTSILGVFGQAQGAIVLDEANPAASSVTASVTTASLWTSDATRDEHVRSPRWLNAAAAPAITFQSTAVTVTGEGTAQVAGDLTINNVTRPVTLTVRLNKIGQNPASPRRTAGFTITGKISRRDFGLTTAPALIGDEVGIHIETLALERAG